MPKSSIESTSKGWMPGVTKIAVPSTNFAAGNYGRRAVVIHIMDGWTAGTRTYFQDSARKLSAHFGVSETGQSDQYVSVLDSAYANGASWNAAQRCWVDPQGHLLKAPHAPTWKLIQPPTNPNLQTISIELEGKHTVPRPDAQLAAVVRVLQYISGQFPTFLPTYRVGETLIGHRDISTIEKANCPGPYVNLGLLASLANGSSVPASPLPLVQSYRVRGTPIFQRQDLTGPIVAYLAPGEVVQVDMAYNNGAFHLKDGRGFAALSNVEGPL